MQVIFPVQSEILHSLKPGDEVFITGNLIVARDRSYKKLAEAILAKEKLSLNLVGAGIFFAGPLPLARPADPIIIGPTTSRRMDGFSPTLLSAGVKALIGKGPVSSEVAAACQKYQSVYLQVTGGVAAYLSQFVREMKLLLWPELGPEAVYNLTVEKMPAIVSIDTRGNTGYAFNS